LISGTGGAVLVDGDEIAVDVEGLTAFSPDGVVGDVVAESATADVGAVDAISSVVALAAFFALPEADIGGGMVDAVLGVCPAVPLTGGVRGCFAACAPATIAVEGAVDVTGGVRDPVTVGGGGTKDGTGSVTARF